MHNFAKRARLLLGVGLLAVSVSAIGIAHACTALTTVTANPGAAVAGDSVTITGKGFTPHSQGDVTTRPAEVRMDDQRGAVLATASPQGGGAGGSFSAPITVPQVPPGDHVIIVTQLDPAGKPVYGTPARQVLTVTAPSDSGQPAGQLAVPPPAAAPGSQPDAGQTAAGTTDAGQSSGTPAAKPPGSKAALKNAVANCKKNYNSKKAKTAAGKKRLAKQRAACISKAKSRY